MTDPEHLLRECPRCECPCPGGDLVACACGSLLSSCELRVASRWESSPDPDRGTEAWYLDGGNAAPITAAVLRALLRLRARGTRAAEPVPRRMAALWSEWQLRLRPWQLPKGFCEPVLYPEEPLLDRRRVPWGFADDVRLRPGVGYMGDTRIVRSLPTATTALVAGEVRAFARVGPYLLAECGHPTHRRTLVVLDAARRLPARTVHARLARELRAFLAARGA